MKKKLSILLVMLLLICAVALVSCGGNKDKQTPSTGNNGTTNTPACKHDDPTQIVMVDAVPPTCQKTGLTEGMKCTSCETMVLPQTVVDIIDCIESDWIVDIDVTHSEDGKRHKECRMCKNIIKEEILLAGCKLFEYTLLPNNTYEVIGIKESEYTDILIPSEYKGLPVTSIGNMAFYHCSSLTSVVIGDSVTSIGGCAFYNCYNLTSVVIGDNVTSIGDCAFLDCDDLTSVVIGDSVTYIGNMAFGDMVFEGYSKLQFNEYENCQYLGSKDNPHFALINVINQNLSSYTIHEDTKVVANSVFSSCSRLTSIVIPNGVTSIGNSAFYGCDSLSSIVIPDSVTYIGSSAFKYCYSLTSVVIPDSVTSIGDYAFAFCDSLTSVVIGDSVASIGSCAFSGCSNLGDIYYTGSEEEWKAISIGSSNSELTNATIIYNYVPEN